MPDLLAPELDGADAAGRARANGLELAWEQFGHDRDPALLLIMGLGTQLTGWPDAFCRALAETGLRVIRFDNRDIGLSTKLCDANDHDSPRAAMWKSFFNRPIAAPYALEDMAADTVGLMDALAIEAAHLVGASMGGMIAQLVAALYPARALSLTSIMSSTGARHLPRGRLKILLRLGQTPHSDDPDTVAQHMARTMRLIGSPEYGRSLDGWTSEIRRSVRRSYYPPGTRRQLLAMMTAAPRDDLLAGVACPALVIHGRDDPLLPVKHGRATADCLPQATYEEIEGMGHDLPPRLLPFFVDRIAGLVHAESKR